MAYEVKWKYQRDTAFPARKKERMKENHYLKCNVMPAGPKGLLNAFIVSSIPADFDIFPPYNNSSSFLSTLKS